MIYLDRIIFGISLFCKILLKKLTLAFSYYFGYY